MDLKTGINVVALGCFVSFAWGTKGHFVSDGRMPAGMLVVAVLSLFGWAWFAVRTATSGIGSGAPYALALMAGAACLFWWAVKTTRKRRLRIAFAQDQPQAVYKTGPYRFVRHPFYLSYVLYWFGTGLATRGLWGWMAPAILSPIYVGLALREERGFGASRLSDAYCQYRRDTGMLIPWPRPFRQKGFSRHG